MIRCILKKSDATIAKPEKVKFTNRQICMEVLLFMGLVIAIYLFCALISFDPADPGWSQTAWHDPIRNWGGAFGAYWSDIFLQFLGFIAYTVPLLIVLFCLQSMRYFYYRNDEPINFLSLSLRVIGVLAFLFSASGFFALNIIDLEQFQAGGILGDIVAGEMLPLLGHIGSSIILFAISFVCITLLTGVSWFFIAEMIGLSVVFISTPIIAFLVNKLFRRQSRNELPEQDDDEVTPAVHVPLADAEPETITNPAPVISQEVAQESVSTTVSETFRESIPETVVESKAAPWFANSDTIASSVIEKTITDTTITDTTVIADENTRASLPVESNQSAPVVDAKLTTTTLPDSEIPLIDENNPPVISVNNYTAPREFTINADYYSPISLNKSSGESDKETIQLVAIDDDIIAPVGSYGVMTGVMTGGTSDVIAEPTEPDTEHAPQQANEIVNTISTQPQQSMIEQDSYQPTELVNEIQAEPEPVPAYEPKAAITKENIHDSLIHPLLQRDHKPLQKPTTPLPALDLLTSPPVKQVAIDHNALKAMAELIEKSLSDFRVKARVVDYLPGPVITRFEIELAPGVKASRISTLDRDLARSLSMPSVRVVEVIPGKPYVGIELPNNHRQTVYFREVLDSPQFVEAKSPLTMVLGKDIAGQSVVADLAKMPHLLVAGTTGSGKSVGVNAMILSFLYKSQPEDVRFIMIDPKMLELSVYEGIPHLLTDVVTDMKDAANALNWCVNEMERRYRLMSALGVRNIAGYNDKIKLAQEMGRPIPDPLWRPGDSMDIDIPMLEKLPYIVVLVDEFADLIMAVGKKIEELIARLAQKARAAGIHLVLATQRPSVDVITGLIKANIPTRIAFTVSSKIDSRTILDQMGAESLLGMGDMLYLAPNSSIPIRVHGAFVRDEEVHSVVQDWKARGIPTQYVQNITSGSSDGDDGDGYDSGEEELDPLFDQVVAFVVDKRRASISSVQRQFRIGYNRAARIVEQMETQGIVSAPSHNGNREVLAPPAGQDY